MSVPFVFKRVSGFAKILLLSVILIFSLASCENETVAPSGIISNNLIIVTDNDPGSFVMIKVLGKVRTAFPDINITFLQSKKYDIYEGAFLLNTALQSFPEGSVIAGLIEPGAAGKRLVMKAGNRFVFAPDNTLATWILSDYPGTACYYVENPSVLEGNQSRDLSFEDFYADAICSLIRGIPCSEFGAMNNSSAAFAVQKPVVEGNSYLGQVMFTDNFGNCITNIPASLISSIPLGTTLTLKSDTVQVNLKLGTTYSSVSESENVCFVNSSKLLEIAVNYGSFSAKYGIKSGARLQLIK